MATSEQLAALGFSPGTTYQGSQPTTTDARQASYAQLQALGFVPGEQAPVEEPASIGKTLALNATNVFGIAPWLNGVIQNIATGEDRNTARDRYQQMIDDANEEHPIVGGLGKVAALVPETVLGGGLGKLAQGAGVAAKAGGLLSKFAPAAIAESPLAASIGKAALGGAAYGAVSGGGEALSRGQDALPEAIKGGAAGAVLGGGLGAIAHGLGRVFHGDGPKATQLEDLAGGTVDVTAEPGVAGISKTQASSLLNGITDGILPKERAIAKDILDNASDVIVKHEKPLRLAGSDNLDKADKGVEELRQASQALETPKDPAYEVLKTHKAGGDDVVKIEGELRNKAATLEGKDAKEVEALADHFRNKYSSIETNEAKRLLNSIKAEGDQSVRDVYEKFAAQLPEGQRWTMGQFLDHLAGGNAKNDSHLIDTKLREAVEGLPFRFESNPISPKQLRAELTKAQTTASDALGSLYGTPNYKLNQVAKDALQTVNNRSLNTAYEAGNDAVKKAVNEIRKINREQSALIQLTDWAEARVEKAALNKEGLGKKTVSAGSNLLAGYEGLGAAKHLLHGDVGGAAIDLGGAIAAKTVPKLAKGGKNLAIDKLARLQRNAQSADPVVKANAQKILDRIKALQKVGSATAGALGAVRNTNAGDES